MRICIQKSTGKIIDSQSHATVGTLIQNVLRENDEATGLPRYREEDIEEQVITEEQWENLRAAFPALQLSKTQLEILQETVDQLVLDSLGV